MLPIKRRQQILSWIKEEETLRISDISKRLNVSEMTVYRDIKPLIDNGQVIKTAAWNRLESAEAAAWTNVFSLRKRTESETFRANRQN